MPPIPPRHFGLHDMAWNETSSSSNEHIVEAEKKVSVADRQHLLAFLK